MASHDYPACALYRGGRCTCDEATQLEASELDIEQQFTAPAASVQTSAQQTTTEKCYSVSDEDFCHSTLHDVLDEIHNSHSMSGLQPGDTFHQGDAIKRPASSYFDIDSLLELMGERGADDGGEYADSFPDVTAAERAELEGMIKRWLDAHVSVGFYQVKNVEKVVVTEDMVRDFHGTQAPAS